MSSLWRASAPIPFTELIDGRLHALGVSVEVNPPGRMFRDDIHCARLGDGKDNFLWAFEGVDGAVADFERFSTNDASWIIDAIETCFTVEMFEEGTTGFDVAAPGYFPKAPD